MVDLKFTFPDLATPDIKKNLPDQTRSSRDLKKNYADPDKKEKEEEKKLPLFYHHKIRAPRYEFF